MEHQTLEQLKEEVAKEEAEAENTALQAEIEEEEEPEAEEPDNSEPEGNAEEPEEDEGDQEPDEPWMQSEEQDSQENQSTFTASDLARQRRKFKAKLKNQDEEMEQLRAENEALKSGPKPKEPQGDLGPRPLLKDFGYDEEAHAAALDTWYDAKLDGKLSARDTSQQQSQAQGAQRRAITDAVDSHDERAASLIAAKKFTAEDYVGADGRVREALDQVIPGHGEDVADKLISQMGEGSEKLWYYLGKNARALRSLQGKMAADPSGLQAMLFLGELKAKVAAPPSKPQSNTPKPGKKLKGDVGGSGKAGAMQAKWSKSEDPQERISIKREAKRQGIDVSTW